jgi:DNA-binding response OmpR family regulator
MPHLLVIDDEPGLRTLYQRALSAEGYEVDTAADCAQALSILGSRSIDLVVLDIQLGGQNGLDLLNTISRDYRTTPVILCTAYSCYQEDLSSWQAHAYLVKSSNLEPLKQEIRRLVGR